MDNVENNSFLKGFVVGDKLDIYADNRISIQPWSVAENETLTIYRADSILLTNPILEVK